MCRIVCTTEDRSRSPWIRPRGRIKSCVREGFNPYRGREDAVNVSVMLYADGSIKLSEQIGKIRDVSRVGGIRVRSPQEVAHAASIQTVVAATFGVRRSETLPHMVRHDYNAPSGSAVKGGRRGHGVYIALRCQVRDSIVHEHCVEPRVFNPQRTHIALNVREFGVDPATDLDHFWREVRQRHGELLLHVGGIVAATGSQFEYGSHRADRGFHNERGVEFRLLPVIMGSGEQMKPGGEVRV